MAAVENHYGWSVFKQAIEGDCRPKMVRERKGRRAVALLFRVTSERGEPDPVGRIGPSEDQHHQNCNLDTPFHAVRPG